MEYHHSGIPAISSTSVHASSGIMGRGNVHIRGRKVLTLTLNLTLTLTLTPMSVQMLTRAPLSNSQTFGSSIRLKSYPGHDWALRTVMFLMLLLNRLGLGLRFGFRTHDINCALDHTGPSPRSGHP